MAKSKPISGSSVWNLYSSRMTKSFLTSELFRCRCRRFLATLPSDGIAVSLPCCSLAKVGWRLCTGVVDSSNWWLDERRVMGGNDASRAASFDDVSSQASNSERCRVSRNCSGFERRSSGEVVRCPSTTSQNDKHSSTTIRLVDRTISLVDVMVVDN